MCVRVNEWMLNRVPSILQWVWEIKHNHVINIRCVRILKHWNIPIILNQTQNSIPVCGNVMFVYVLYVHVMGFSRNIECMWKCVVKIAATESEQFSRNMKQTKVSKAHEYLDFGWICARRSCTWVNTLCKMWPDKVWKFTELDKKLENQSKHQIWLHLLDSYFMVSMLIIWWKMVKLMVCTSIFYHRFDFLKLVFYYCNYIMFY